MVKESEKFKEEDERNAKRIESKNKFENYLYNTKNSTDDMKISNEHKDQIKEIVTENLKWLESSQNSTTEEFENKQKEAETAIQPLMVPDLETKPEPETKSTPTKQPEPKIKIEEVD
jgi:L1 cell adhesion molecule like protein